MDLLKPINLGSELVKELNQAKVIVEEANRISSKMILSAKQKTTSVYQASFTKGLLDGTKDVYEHLVSEAKISKQLKARIESMVITVITKILSEVTEENLDEILEKSLIKRISDGLDATENLTENSQSDIILVISRETKESDIIHLRETYPWLEISVDDSIGRNRFILKSSYGEIESDPYAYLNSIEENLESILNYESIFIADNKNE